MSPIPESVEEIPEPVKETKKEIVKAENNQKSVEDKQIIQDGKKLLHLLGNALVLRVQDLRKQIVSQ